MIVVEENKPAIVVFQHKVEVAKHLKIHELPICQAVVVADNGD
jgi:hypothetical protein